MDVARSNKALWVHHGPAHIDGWTSMFLAKGSFMFFPKSSMYGTGTYNNHIYIDHTLTFGPPLQHVHCTKTQQPLPSIPLQSVSGYEAQAHGKPTSTWMDLDGL